MALISYHERMKMDEEFVVYRPPLSSGKLEGTYYNPPGWKPSQSYKYKLEDIKNQFTPAEYFRHTLATSGKYIRLIQKLERRWQKNHNDWIRSAIKIQARHRGNVGRAYFFTVKIELIEKLRRRECLADAITNFETANYIECIIACHRYEPITLELLIIKLKCFFQMTEYESCIRAADEIIVMNAFIEDAYYIKSCAYLKMNKDYEAAYDALKMMMIQLEEPRDDSFRLFGYIAVKLQPKLFLEAVDSFDVLIRRNPKDFEALKHRACCYSCIQEWDLVLKDLNFILAFKPDLVPVRMIRARAFTCMRKWSEAKADYMHIIYNCPVKYHAAAQKGIDEMTHVTTVLPMIDADILNNV